MDLLLDKIDFNADRDHLITTGDNIGKGLDSAGVVERLIEIGASSVRGNWEDRVLKLADSEAEMGVTPAVACRSTKKDYKILAKLQPHHIDWLRSAPVILKIPALSPPAKVRGSRIDATKGIGTMLEDIYVVHAGLVPGVAMVDQDSYSVMNMRALTKKKHIPNADRHKGKPWFKVWNKYQRFVAHETTNILPGPFYAIYGHDSKTGRKFGEFSRGLDSSCVAGGMLSALTVDAWGRQTLRTVSCKHLKAKHKSDLDHAHPDSTSGD